MTAGGLMFAAEGLDAPQLADSRAGAAASTIADLHRYRWTCAPMVRRLPSGRLLRGVRCRALRTLELLGITPGQRVVVMGATGGVGGYPVQMARSREAHVIATVRGDVDEARRLRALERGLAIEARVYAKARRPVQPRVLVGGGWLGSS
jgi:hypothetical protein